MLCMLCLGLYSFLSKVESLTFTNYQAHQRNAFVVTGSNGYVGRAVVHELLNELLLIEEGNQLESSNTIVLCLARSHHVAAEELYWQKNCPSESPLLHVFPYDMLDHGKSLEIALSRFLIHCGDERSSNHTGCKPTISVFHVASVFGPTENHRQTALDNVRGTVDLITCLSKVGKGICRILLILTSSMAAVRGSGQTPMNGQFYTPDDWNTVSQLGADWGSSYQWSKAEAERQAWNLCQLYNISMTSLCPSFVFGPPFGDGTSSSYSFTLVHQWIRGESKVQSRLFVDIRDVAKAHVRAALRKEAIGRRYILSSEARIPSQQIAIWLHEACCNAGLPLADPDSIQYDSEFTGGSIPIGTKEVESVKSLRNDLQVELRPVNDTIIDMAKFILATAKS